MDSKRSIILARGGLDQFIKTGRRALLTAATVATALLAATHVQAQSLVPSPPQIAGTSYILVDATTGRVIMEENADERLPPASLTKIMTAYIAEVELDNGNMDMDDEVYVSENAWSTQGSKMFLDVDSYVPVSDIMRGIIIQSGNDASVAMAEHIAGSEDAFADLMNQHAEALGLENSSFMNASGLDTEDNYNRMSARDLAELSRVTIRDHPEHYDIYSEREFTYNGITQQNRNTLLFRDSSVDGIKTGWTEAAGYCLVASAVRNDMRLISVVMGTVSEEARVVETQKMLNYGFRFYETHNLYEGGEVLTTTRVWSGDTNSLELGVPEAVNLTIPRGRSDELNASLDIDEVIKAGVEEGQVMGTVNITLEDQQLYSGDVVALHAVEQGGWIKRIIDALTLFFMNLFSG